MGAVNPLPITWRSFPLSEWLTVQVTDDQLTALNQSRGAGELNLRVNLRSLLLQAPEGFHALAEDQMNLSIVEPVWLGMLDRVGVETGFLIRVAGPFVGAVEDGAGDKDIPSLALALARLRRAREELRDGQYEQCVATCRRVLENVQRLSGPQPSWNSMKTKDRRALDENERWAMMFQSVLALTQPAHHDDEITVGFSYDRPKAEAVLAATAGLLNVFKSK
ncbi:hypothetical protein [Micromonospora globbae]|uniref:hypothetical protein n=1 Tax=Micromonospora globbae TaxID=1894969 RepID=UPI003435848A